MVKTIKQVPAAKSNYTKGRGGHAISMIVIHTQQGSEHGTEAWFADPHAHASAHYGISFAGDVSQFVDDADTAWHAGNAVINKISIAVELEGFEEKGEFPPPMMAALAELVNELCTKYSIPVDRAHIIGHAEVPDPNHPGKFGGANNHTDPGPAFPFSELMAALTPASVS